MGSSVKIKTRFKFLVTVCIVLLHIFCTAKASVLGSCYRLHYKNAEDCGQLLRSAISRDQCCTGHHRRAWSPNVTPTRFQGHQPQGHASHNSSYVFQPPLWEKGNQRDIIDTDLEIRRNRHSSHGCQPCNTSCKDVKCGEDRKCLLRNGIPKCVCSPQCHLQHKAAVCGTDGRTYSSECQLLKRSCRKKQRLLVAHSGPCQTCTGVRCGSKRSCVLTELLTPQCVRCSKSCPAAEGRRPICGSDGVTYPSRCFLKKASCEAGFTIKKAYKGPCKEGATCQNVKCWRDEKCLYDYVTNQPQCLWCGDLRHCYSSSTRICGSDKTTYQSWCALRHTSCRTQKALRAIPLSNCVKNTTNTEGKSCSSKSVNLKKKEKIKKKKGKKKKKKRYNIGSLRKGSKRIQVQKVEDNMTEVENTEVEKVIVGGSPDILNYEAMKKQRSSKRIRPRKGTRRKNKKKKKIKDC